MKYFIDTHDREKGSFPEEEIPKEEFAEWFNRFEEAYEKEGAVTLGTHVNLEEGKAFCLTAAPDAEAVHRAHETVGVMFDSITEVKHVSDM